MIRRLIVPLTVAVVTFHAGQAFAQGAFPAPLPNQAAPEQRIAVSAGQRSRTRGVGWRAFGFPEHRRCPDLGLRRSIGDRTAVGRSAGRLHEGVRPLARRGGKARQDDQGRERAPCTAGRGLQADRKFRRGRSQDDQLRRGQCGEMRNSAADRRTAQDRPQEHRGDADRRSARWRSRRRRADRPAPASAKCWALRQRSPRRNR